METTTTTTTLIGRILSLASVDTVVVTPQGEFLGTCSSDDKGTIKTINSYAMSFGIIAPGELSETQIIYLNVPTSLAINNIKLALVDTGGFSFDEVKFGVEIQSYIDYNIIPSAQFSGVNSTKDINSIYNIEIGNKELYSSNYVYLNILIPEGQIMSSGVIRYHWFFDYS